MSLTDRLDIKNNYHRYYGRVRVWSQKSQTQISGFVSLTIFTVAFFLYFAILPTLKTIGSLNKEINDQQEVINTMTKKINDLTIAETNYAQVINDLKSIDRVLPKTEEFERLAWQVQWLAQQTGVTITTGSFGEFSLVGERPSNDLKPLLMNLSISGSYQQIKQYLQSLTKIDRLITIEEVSFNQQNLKVGGGLTANLKLTGFYLPKKEQND